MEGCDNKYPAFAHTIVFEKGLIPLQSVLNTDSDESWHTLCVHLLNVCLSLPLHTLVSHCILPDRLHSSQCLNARSLSVNLSLFIQFFSVFFVGCDSQIYTVGGHQISFGQRPRNYTIIDFWSGLDNPSDLDLVIAYAIISQLTSDQVSTTHQMPKVI